MASRVGRTTPYKDFLQAALHRRFASTATVLIVVSYVEALFLTTWDSYIWSWFPLGPTGIRAFFLFLCGLFVLILRIAQYHVGLRTSNSAFHTFVQHAVKIQTAESLIAYGLSSWVFFPVFLSSRSEASHLNWIHTPSGGRARLNEKPVFLACYLITCGAIQAFEHLWRDRDRLSLGGSAGNDDNEIKGSGDAANSLKQVLGKIPGALIQAVARSFAALFGNIIFYHFFLRSFAWRFALFFLRSFYSLPKTSMVPPTSPATFTTLLQCFIGGSLLFFLWGSGNLAFSTFMVKEPLKNGQPLTNESKDPNGSLLQGLKSKKLSIRTFAMWELAYIARDFEERRKSVFEDIDRKDGPMWSQVYVICLNIVKSIETRIDEYGKAPVAPKAPAIPAEPKARVSAPPREDTIYSRQAASKLMRDEVEKTVGHVVRSPGHSPLSKLSPLAKRTLKGTKDRLLTQEQQDAMTTQNMMNTLQGAVLKLVGLNVIGPVFRQEFARRFTAVTLGTPYAEISLYVNAINVLSLLSVKSLGEDKFGNVHRDVPTIIRTFGGVIRKLESFKSTFPTHWTDIERNTTTPEVDRVLEALKAGLAQVVSEFEPYSSDLRLTLTDLRLAKEAAGLSRENGGEQPEMEEARTNRR